MQISLKILKNYTISLESGRIEFFHSKPEPNPTWNNPSKNLTRPEKSAQSKLDPCFKESQTNLNPTCDLTVFLDQFDPTQPDTPKPDQPADLPPLVALSVP